MNPVIESDVVSSQGISEDEGLQWEKMKQEYSDNFGEVCVSNYRRVKVTMDLTKISEPEQTLRPLGIDHVARMEAELKRNGYMENVGLISVAMTEKMRWTITGETLKGKVGYDGSGELKGGACVVDGRHRLRAIRKLMLKDKEWMRRMSRISVMLWMPLEGDFLSDMEVLSIGGCCNCGSSTVGKPTFRDHVHAAVSMARVVPVSMHEEGFGTGISVGALAVALKNGGVLGNLGIRHTHRYARVAIKLLKSERNYDSFMDVSQQCPRLSLVHISNESLLGNTSDTEFELGLQGICAKVLAGGGGSFDKIQKDFYALFSSLVEELNLAARAKRISLESLLGQKVQVMFDKTEIRQLVTTKMMGFKISTTPRLQKKSTKGATEAIRKALLQIAGAEYWRVGIAEDIADEGRSRKGSGETVEDENFMENGLGEKVPAQRQRRTNVEGTLVPARLEDVKQSLESEVVENSILGEVPREWDDTQSSSSNELASDHDSYQPRNHGSAEHSNHGSDKHSDFQSEQRSDLRSEHGSDQDGDHGGARKRRRVVVSEGSEDEDGTRDLDVHCKEDAQDVPGKAVWRDGLAFDDTIPAELPVGAVKPVPCAKESLASDEMRVNHAVLRPTAEKGITRFLDTLFLPQRHRANVMLRDTTILEANHSKVYRCAAHNYYLSHQHEVGGHEDGGMQGDGEASTRLKIGEDIDAVALVYFGRCREKLMQRGFCVLKGFVGDELLSSNVSGLGKNAMRLDLAELFEAVRSTFPGLERLKRGGAQKGRAQWELDICGDGTAQSYACTTTNRGVTKFMEEETSRVWMCLKRSLLDATIGQAMAALGAWDNRASVVSKMYAPETGGRWKLTVEGCVRQELHSDFGIDRMREGAGGGLGPLNGKELKSPGFFTVTTASQEAAVWVCPFSHQLLRMAGEGQVAALSNGLNVFKVRVPPFSIFVGRGDMMYCDAGFDDYRSSDPVLRYHMYFVPADCGAPSGYHVVQHFNPQFRKSEEGEEKGAADAEADTEGESEERGHGSDTVGMSKLKLRRSGRLASEGALDTSVDEKVGMRTKEVDVALQPLSTAERKKVNALTARKHSVEDKISFIEEAKIWLKVKDFKQLRHKQWLGDEIMNAFVALVNARYGMRQSPRVYVMSTMFTVRLCGPEFQKYDYDGVKNWLSAGKILVEGLDKILVPTHVEGQHWVLISVDIRRKKVLYLDSLQGEDKLKVMEHVLRWLDDEVSDKCTAQQREAFGDIDTWERVTNPPYTPQQLDLESCGVFVLFMVYFIALGKPPTFKQSDIKTLRRRAALFLKDGFPPEKSS